MSPKSFARHSFQIVLTCWGNKVLGVCLKEPVNIPLLVVTLTDSMNLPEGKRERALCGDREDNLQIKQQETVMDTPTPHPTLHLHPTFFAFCCTLGMVITVFNLFHEDVLNSDHPRSDVSPSCPS